jgi:hypothetical protein
MLEGFIFGLLGSLGLGIIIILPAACIVASIKGKSAEKSKARSELNGQDNRVPCPQCAELIMPNAKICRFCKYNLNG